MLIFRLNCPKGMEGDLPSDILSMSFTHDTWIRDSFILVFVTLDILTSSRSLLFSLVESHLSNRIGLILQQRIC